jgi:hypothetical protein
MGIRVPEVSTSLRAALLHLTPLQLVTNDGRERSVAVYRRGRVGVVRRARPSSLEILPEGENMVDLIVVTSVYVENLRTDRDDQSWDRVTET